MCHFTPPLNSLWVRGSISNSSPGIYIGSAGRDQPRRSRLRESNRRLAGVSHIPLTIRPSLWCDEPTFGMTKSSKVKNNAGAVGLMILRRRVTGYYQGSYSRVNSVEAGYKVPRTHFP